MGSTAPNGSSISRTGGSAARARATPTRCCWPPESWRGYRPWNSRGSRPTRSSISSTRSFTPDFDQPVILGTRAMFSATVMCGKSPEDWIAYPILRRSFTGSMSVTSSSLILIRPDVGSISRLIIFSVVDFPQPDGPTRITVSPALMSIVTLSTAGAGLPG